MSVTVLATSLEPILRAAKDLGVEMLAPTRQEIQEKSFFIKNDHGGLIEFQDATQPIQ